MIPYDRVRDRYLHDPAFHHVVDSLRAVILDMRMTPSEVREAAMLACQMIEERRPIGPIPLRRPIGEPPQCWPHEDGREREKP